MLIVPPQSTFHCVEMASTGEVKEITSITDFPVGINGGYFVLKQEIIDLIPENGDLVGDACFRWPGRAGSSAIGTTDSGSRPTLSKNVLS